MPTILKQFILTDKTKDGKELINKFGNPYKMLHLLVLENWQEKWISKFVSTDYDVTHKELLEEISKHIDKEIIVTYTQSGQYYNLTSITFPKEATDVTSKETSLE